MHLSFPPGRVNVNLFTSALSLSLSLAACSNCAASSSTNFYHVNFNQCSPLLHVWHEFSLNTAKYLLLEGVMTRKVCRSAVIIFLVESICIVQYLFQNMSVQWHNVVNDSVIKLVYVLLSVQSVCDYNYNTLDWSPVPPRKIFQNTTWRQLY